MNQKELTKTFMMISNKKKNFVLHGLYRIYQRCKGYNFEHNEYKMAELRRYQKVQNG